MNLLNTKKTPPMGHHSKYTKYRVTATQDRRISIRYFNVTIWDRVPLVLIQSFLQAILMACGSKG